MTELFTFPNLFTLGMLVLLQAVLGFDNLLYISLESKKVAAEQQQYVRRVGICLAIVLRLILLFVLVSVIAYFQNPFFEIRIPGVVEATVTIHSLIVLAGGIFIIYTAVKEIAHMMNLEDRDETEDGTRSTAHAIFWIVLMNLIFSFDSILSALALTKVFAVMATAIVIGGILMIWLADHVATFLKKNRMYEVLGLFILFVVGIMLLSEGGHLAHLHLFNFPVTPMSKATFYFVIAVLVITDIVQSRYQKKLLLSKKT
jgi:predicted tellurium resistance membrane protein TerC